MLPLQVTLVVEHVLLDTCKQPHCAWIEVVPLIFFEDFSQVTTVAVPLLEFTVIKSGLFKLKLDLLFFCGIWI